MRKLVALFILICVFFPLAVTAMSLTSIRPWVLDRSFYERIVSDERIYEPALIAEMPVRFNRTVLNDTEQIPLEALKIALDAVVTPEYLRGQAVSMVNQIFDFIEGRSSNAEIVVDIAFVKAALLVPSVLFALMGLSLALPLVSEVMYNRAIAINWGGVEYSEAFRQAITDMSVYIVQRLGSGFLLTSIVSSVIALGLLVLGWNMTPSQQRTGKIVHIPA